MNFAATSGIVLLIVILTNLTTLRSQQLQHSQKLARNNATSNSTTKPPFEVENGYMCDNETTPVNGSNILTSVTYCCNDDGSSQIGFGSDGSMTSTLLGDGTWTGPPACAPAIPYGSVCGSMVTTGDDPDFPSLPSLHVEYCCSNDEKPPGNIVVRVGNQKWPSELPRCVSDATDTFKNEDTYLDPPYIKSSWPCVGMKIFPDYSTGEPPISYQQDYCCPDGYDFFNKSNSITRLATYPSWPVGPGGHCLPITSNGYVCSVNISAGSNDDPNGLINATYCCNEGSVMIGSPFIQIKFDDSTVKLNLACINKSQQAIIVAAMAIRNGTSADRIRDLLNNASLQALFGLPIPSKDETLMTLASSLGRTDVVKLLVEFGASLTGTDSLGRTALAAAVGTKGKLETVKFILNITTDSINDPSYGLILTLDPPLLIAIQTSTPDIVSELISNGADVTATAGSSLNSTLMLAVMRNSTEIVDILLRNKNTNVNAVNSDGNTALILAAKLDYFNIVKLLVEFGNVSLQLMNNDGWTALFTAASFGRTDVASYLIDKGVPVDDSNSKDTPLIAACINSHVETVAMLLNRGANYSIYSADGDELPIHYAASKGNPTILKLLMDHGASADTRDKTDWTPLMYATYANRVDNAIFLISQGVDVNARSSNGNTPLQTAVFNNSFEIVKMLASRTDISVDVVDNQGDTALLVAANQGYEGIANFLIQNASANIRIKNYEGKNALMFAAEENLLTTMQLLLQGGADINATSNDGGNAFFYAAKATENVITLKFLLDHRVDAYRPLIDGRNALMAAASASFDQNVLFMLTKLKFDVNYRDNDGNTTLIYAALNGATSTVSLLLNQSRIDINAVNRFNLTAITIAAASGYSDIARSLISKGAIIGDSFMVAVRSDSSSVIKEYAQANVNMSQGLLVATRLGLVNTIQALIETGASLFAKDEYGRNVLHLAVINGTEFLVQKLLDKDADILQRTPEGDSPLNLAVKNKRGDIAAVLLTNGADPNVADNNGTTPLMVATSLGMNETFFSLLKSGALVNAKDNNGTTALMYAATNNSIDFMRTLLKAGANINSTNREGHTALTYAIRYCDCTRSVNFLIDRNIVIKNASVINMQSPSHVAARFNRTQSIRILLSRKFALANDTDSNGDTAFAIAAQYPYQEIMTRLYNYGADVNLKNNEGNTTLILLASKGLERQIRVLKVYHPSYSLKNKNGDTAIGLAARNGYLRIVKFLMGRKADFISENLQGNTPLLLACTKKNNSDVVKALIDAGANFHVANKVGDTALIIVARVGDLAVVKLLADQGVDIHSRNNAGNTALIEASAKGYTEIVEFLLEKRAYLEAKNDDGYTALLAVSSSGNIGTLTYLVDSKQADINARTASGDTAMTLAARKGYFDIVKELFRRNASIDAVNSNGSTPLLNAVENSQKPIITFLIELGAKVDVQDNITGASAISVASALGDISTVRLLVNQGANFRIRDFKGQTPLMKAANQGHLHVVQLLVQLIIDKANANYPNDPKAAQDAAVADMTTTDNDSLTALLLASWNGYSNIVNFLIGQGAPLAGCPMCFFTIV